MSGEEKDAEEVRRTVVWLRQRSKDELKTLMTQLVENEKVTQYNKHLSAEELDDIKSNLDFPEDKPFITGLTAGTLRDRPQVRPTSKVKPAFSGKIYATHIACKSVLVFLPQTKQLSFCAVYYWLSTEIYPDEDLRKKTDVWWKTHHPFTWEVSHLFDGFRSDINPRNLALEPHDLNKSRAFCRLLFEKKMRDAQAEAEEEEVAKSLERKHKKRKIHHFEKH